MRTIVTSYDATLIDGEPQLQVPAAAYDRLLEEIAPAPRVPSQAAIDQALAVLSNPATEWHDANDVIADILRDGLASARKSAGLTQAQVGAKLGIPQSQVSRMESNPGSISARMLKRLAEILALAHPPR